MNPAVPNLQSHSVAIWNAAGGQSARDYLVRDFRLAGFKRLTRAYEGSFHEELSGTIPSAPGPAWTPIAGVIRVTTV